MLGLLSSRQRGIRGHVFILAVATALCAPLTASAQSQTGEIFGKATDASGAVLPGATVTISAPNLLQPQTAITSATGTYLFPRLEIGVYAVKFELTGFKTVIYTDVRVTVDFSAQINAQLEVSTVQETVTVTGQSPIIDTKDTGTKQTFTNELLQSIPSARDPWVILQQTGGIAMDRENIGGNMSGQQSGVVSRGGNPYNNKWSLDGVDITDMAAVGSSPTYYDFDMFQEMTITTGGVDVTQQTGGVGINLVTKAGSDKFRGSSRAYDTNQRFESQNVTDALRTQGAGAGNPIQNIQDYGIELGGPIKPGRAWIWGAVGKQNIGVGVVGFYEPTSACQQIKADETANPLSHPIADVNNCLNTDLTQLQTTNLKAEVELFKGNKLSLYNLFSKKVRNSRNASDLTPIESTVTQAAVPSSYGPWGWTTGPSPTYKFGDQYVVSDRLLLDVQYTHVGNNFILDYHDDSYATESPVPGVTGLQPTFVIATSLNGRSTPQGSQSVNIRPVNQVTANLSYFLPATVLGDHAIKIGGYWKDANSYTSSHTPGNATARFPTSAELANPNDCATLAVGCQVALTRDGITDYDLLNTALYAQDTITHGRLTMDLGLRYDQNHDQALASSVPANYLVPTILPGINFPGADPGIIFKNFSPRLGLSYDLTGNQKTILRVNYAIYYGQVGTGDVSGEINPVTSVALRYQWQDLNHDGFVEPNEIFDSKGVPLLAGGNPASFLALTGNWNAASPGSATTQNTIDPNLQNDKTSEFILGADHEVGAGFAVGASYIWRRYTNTFTTGPGWAPTVGVSTTGSDYSPVTFTPAAGTCPAGATCPAVTYFQPNFQLGSVTTETNIPNYNRTYNGIELTGRKRMSHHWLMNTSFAYNSAIVNYGVGSYQDPTNIALRNGFQYDYLTSGSGLGNVYINAKWLYKLGGTYQLPWDLNVSAFFNARQGYPEEFAVQSPSRANGAGIATVLLSGVGDTRLPNYQNLDLHLDRAIRIGTVRLLPAVDVFNVFNSNIVQAVRSTENAINANQIQAIVAPRVARFGVRVTW